MKKCPFCQADIEDNARFCLYCMKPLGEKTEAPALQKKPCWPVFLVLAILLAFFLLAFFLLTGRPGASANGEDAPLIPAPLSTPEETTDAFLNDEAPDPTPGETPAHTPEPTGKPTPVQTPAPTAEPTPKPTSEPTPVPTAEPTATPTENPPSTAAPELPDTQASYTYRAARAGDEYNAQYQNTGNDIVITGIAQQSADGVYNIPSHIDGKKVIAIVANAFFCSNAKTVYIPATVKSIWNYAFAGCPLTDVYFRGNAIYAESKAFSGNLTIHCSASCSDRSFRYYKDCAASYDATWEEWNG